MQGPGQRGEGAVGGVGGRGRASTHGASSGLGGVGGRGRASTHGAFSWVADPTKKHDFEFFWGREGGVPGRGRQRRELGAGS